mmetsp:Transcript_3928/g.10139  ORF Transcript_3928/g.10139 Transcript_3928/m.10139 type:complete len:288 (+) Transcript_3928:371-1234(+)
MKLEHYVGSTSSMDPAVFTRRRRRDLLRTMSGHALLGERGGEPEPFSVSPSLGSESEERFGLLVRRLMRLEHAGSSSSMGAACSGRARGAMHCRIRRFSTLLYHFVRDSRTCALHVARAAVRGRLAREVVPDLEELGVGAALGVGARQGIAVLVLRRGRRRGRRGRVVVLDRVLGLDQGDEAPGHALPHPRLGRPRRGGRGVDVEVAGLGAGGRGAAGDRLQGARGEVGEVGGVAALALLGAEAVGAQPAARALGEAGHGDARLRLRHVVHRVLIAAARPARTSPSP